MKHSKLFLACASVLGASVLSFTAPAFAQPKPEKPDANAGAIGAMIEADEATLLRGKGLEGLKDDALMQELANRGLQSLLNRAFELNNVEKNRQAGIMTLIALRELSNPDRAYSTAQRQERVANIVKGIEEALPNINDPKILMQNAATLIRAGVERDVNTIEYWGENPKTQASLKPVIESVLKILDKAHTNAVAEAEKIANKITSPNDPAVRQYMEMDDLSRSSEYTRHMVDYYYVLSMDKADPKRKEVIKTALDFLQQYDNGDSEVQPLVRTRMAKLALQAEDYKIAKRLLDSVGSATEEVKPTPTLPQQFEAKYFSVLCDLQMTQWDDVTKNMNELIAWYKTNLPQDKAVQDGANAAISMLKYRVNVAQSKLMQDEMVRTKAKGMAVQELLQLLHDRPELQGVIFDQLMNQLPENPDYKALDPLLLQAIVRKGDQERVKAEGEEFDKTIILRAIEGAKEVVSRMGQSTITPENAQDASLLIGLFHQKLSEDPKNSTAERDAERIAAGHAFLDYAQKFSSNLDNAKIALDYASAMIARLRQDKVADEQYTKLYDRFLPIAIAPPFKRGEFAFEYALRLQVSKDYAKSAEYFANVPATDPRALVARFYQLVSMKEQLADTTLAPEKRTALVADIQKLADKINQAANEQLASGAEKDKANAQLILVRTTLIAADLAAREKSPERVLQLLNGFEKTIAGSEDEHELLGNALALRVNALMAAGKNNEATDAVVQLIKTRGGEEAGSVVHYLLERLDSDLKTAEANKDTAQIKRIAQDRATLSPFLIEWATSSPDPQVRPKIYDYRLFFAETKRKAAELEEDSEKRRALRMETVALYEKLQSPEGIAEYRMSLVAAKKPPNEAEAGDARVALALGLLQYDLRNYKDAQAKLGKLLIDRKLGTATISAKNDAGQAVTEDNDQYWEANYKLMKSNIELAKGGAPEFAAGLEATRQNLKKLYVTWGKQVGGKRWGEEFEKLRKEQIPDFEFKDEPSATTAPATS